MTGRILPADTRDSPDQGRLVIRCSDRPGIVATVLRFLFERGANIIHSDQHSTDPWGGRFFLRTEFAMPGLAERLPELRRELAPIVDEFGLDVHIVAASERRRQQAPG